MQVSILQDSLKKCQMKLASYTYMLLYTQHIFQYPTELLKLQSIVSIACIVTNSVSVKLCNYIQALLYGCKYLYSMTETVEHNM